MNAQSIRCENDFSLFEALQKEPEVKRVNAMIERQEAESSMSTRRHLLSTSVRLSRDMAPELHDMADDCIERLGVKLSVELYVYSSPKFNAACFKPEGDRLYVMFSSSLLEGFTQQELRFVMGHELGHHIYNHHAVPVGYLLNQSKQTRIDPKLILRLFAWSRYAEISADRAGAHCAQDVDAVARALFKLSSGLTTNFVKFSLDDFVAQVDDMRAVDEAPGRQGAPESDWFSTHPFSPIRVKALKLFESSELYATGKRLATKAELEVGVQSVLSLMEPSYLEAKTDEAEMMRRLLFAGLIAVADADGGISEDELALFNKFFGDYAFSDQLNLNKIKNTIENRALEVAEKVSKTQCMQVMHDLCLIAKADKSVMPEERRVLEKIAADLGLTKLFVTQSLKSLIEND